MIDVTEKLENSFSKIKEMCPKNNVLDGLAVRDSYHQRKYSILTLCQVLWATISSSVYPRSFYLTVDLLKQINYEIEKQEYFKKYDRVIADAFIFLAYVHTGQSVDSNVYTTILSEIIRKQNADGWWSTYSGGEADIRATSLCLLALSECYSHVYASDTKPYSDVRTAIMNAANWLVKQYVMGKYCERVVQTMNANNTVKTYGIELTAMASYSLIKCSDALSRTGFEILNAKNVVVGSAKWLMTLKPSDIKNSIEVEQEKYVDESILLVHDYSTGDLEIVILFLSEFLMSSFYTFIDGAYSYLDKAVSLLIDNEKNGEWFDKHSQSYNRIWRISYAVVALANYKRYVQEEEEYKLYAKRKRTDFVGKLKKIAFKYFFNPVLDVIYLLIAAVVFYFREFLLIRAEFINSTAVSIIGLILGLFGLIFPRIEKWYEERKER